MAGDSTALAPGTLLGERYQLAEPIGSGAMGMAFEARDVVADTRVVVKVLDRELVTSREYVTRFKREALNATRFRHESAARAVGYGQTTDGLPYVVMEFVEGRSLGDVLEADGPLSVGRACHLVRHVLRALGAAHQRGIVHRDVRPENVRVLTDADGIERPKVLDFGIVNVVGGDAGDVEGAVRTKSGMLLGEARYLAPEQVRGDVVDGRVDIYAAGAILYELLAGEPPFVSDDSFGLLKMHLESQVEPLAKRAPERDVPAELDAILLRMLEKDPRARPADATRLADTIGRWAVEDPRAEERERALRRGMLVAALSGLVTAGAAFTLTPRLAPAVAAAGIGLGLGAALSAWWQPRPSVPAFWKRLLGATLAIAALSAAATHAPGSPGPYGALGFGLTALVAYAAYLSVWTLRARWTRLVVVGGVATALAACLVPIRVDPPSGKVYYVSTFTEAAPELVWVQAAARTESLVAVLLICAVFAIASLALPRPAAARI